jgi:outer membrane protein assembly factor BamB
MKISTGKSKTALIALFLMSAMAISLVALPTANAHTPTWNVPSFAYLVTVPNPVGAGQRVSIMMWVDLPMPNAAVENDIRRHDYKLTITKPDNTTQTFDWPVVDDSTGVQWFPYTPEKAGIYTLKFEYKGQVYTWNATSAQRTWTNDTFLPASATKTLTVQEELLPNPRTSYPLPAEYWTRPIEGQNTDWYSISSNWLRGPYIRYGTSATEVTALISGRYTPDGIGPNSPHVMWSKPIQDGGVVGGSRVGVEGNTYYMGGSYNVRWSAAIAMYGRLYYSEPYGNSGGGGDYVCVDLRTGEELWRINTTIGGVPSFGYLYDFDSPNQHGVLPEGLLFTNNFARSYDPSTGVLTTMNVTGVPSGTEDVGSQGEILRYVLNSAGKWLAQWNSSRAFGGAAGTGVGSWYSGTINASLASNYDWNISIPSLGSGTWAINRYAIFNNILLLEQGSLGSGPRVNGAGENITAVNLNASKGAVGQVLWTHYYPPAPNNVTRKIIAVDPDVGVFVAEDKETLRLTGYSLANGDELWSVAHAKADIDTLRTTGVNAYGNLYCAGFDGILYAYDLENGNLLWTYGNGGLGNSTYAGLGTAYGEYPIFIDVIADGKVYLATTEHSPNSPWYKDVRYRCVNATTGEEIWTLMGWGTGMYAGGYDIVADGFFVFANMYDMQVYTIGKGPSAMTVEAPMTAVLQGSSLVIRGSVTDISAGTEQDVIARRFPNGVPAVSDASMSEWMEYVYMQKPRPTNATGVQVTLDVIDSNNNYRNIGTTTSDSNGFFSFQWTPDIPGKYTVIATFAGSESYWPSHAETAFAVDAAPEATPGPTPTPQSMAEMYFLPSVAGIIVAIAVAGAVIVLIMLRKRP